MKQQLAKGVRAVLPQSTVGDIENRYRKTRARLMAARYGHPARTLKVIAVTGTNGKTTTVNYLNEILKEVGREVVLIEKNREMERVRREIEGQVPDAEKRKDVEKRVELIRKEMTDRVEEWKKEPLPETLGGSGAVE